jgi:hypothetical protein
VPWAETELAAQLHGRTRLSQAVLSQPGPASDRPTAQPAPAGPEGGHGPAALSAGVHGLKHARGHGGRDAKGTGGPVVLAVPAMRSCAEATWRMWWVRATHFVGWRGGKLCRSGRPWRHTSGADLVGGRGVRSSVA